MSGWVNDFFLHWDIPTLGRTLLHFWWQGGILAALLAVWLRVTSQSSHVRYLASCATLAIMAVCPFATYSYLSPEPVSDVGMAFSAYTTEITADHWIVGCWMAGVSVLLVRFLVNWVRLRGLRSLKAEPVSSLWEDRMSHLFHAWKIRARVRLVSSASVAVPMTLGFVRPLILVPTSLISGLTPQQIESILAHEMAHIRRRDYLVNIIQTMIESILFYHPAVWWVSNRIRIEREYCCDDLAVSVSGDPLSYARALTELEARRGHHLRLGLSATGGPLMNRVRRLVGLGDTQPRDASPSPAAIVAFLCLAVVSSMATLASATQDSNTPDPQEQEETVQTVYIQVSEDGTAHYYVLDENGNEASIEVDLTLPQEIDLTLPQEIDLTLPQEIDLTLPQEIDLTLPQEIDLTLPQENDLTRYVHIDDVTVNEDSVTITPMTIDGTESTVTYSTVIDGTTQVVTLNEPTLTTTLTLDEEGNVCSQGSSSIYYLTTEEDATEGTVRYLSPGQTVISVKPVSPEGGQGETRVLSLLEQEEGSIYYLGKDKSKNKAKGKGRGNVYYLGKGKGKGKGKGRGNVYYLDKDDAKGNVYYRSKTSPKSRPGLKPGTYHLEVGEDGSLHFRPIGKGNAQVKSAPKVKPGQSLFGLKQNKVKSHGKAKSKKKGKAKSKSRTRYKLLGKSQESSSLYPSVTTDEQGRFNYTAPGISTLRGRVVTPSGEPVEGSRVQLGALESVDGNLTLVAPPTEDGNLIVSGMVVTPEGEPVDSASVTLGLDGGNVTLISPDGTPLRSNRAGKILTPQSRGSTLMRGGKARVLTPSQNRTTILGGGEARVLTPESGGTIILGEGEVKTLSSGDKTYRVEVDSEGRTVITEVKKKKGSKRRGKSNPKIYY